MSDLIHCQIDCKLFWYNSHQLLKKKVKIIFVCRSNSALPIPGCYHYWLLLWAKKLNLLKFFLSTLHLCRCDCIQILLSSLHFHNGVQTLITPHGWYHCCFVTGNWIRGHFIHGDKQEGKWFLLGAGSAPPLFGEMGLHPPVVTWCIWGFLSLSSSTRKSQEHSGKASPADHKKEETVILPDLNNCHEYVLPCIGPLEVIWQSLT